MRRRKEEEERGGGEEFHNSAGQELLPGNFLKVVVLASKLYCSPIPPHL